MSESESPQAPWEVDIDTLVADRQAFSEFVYTPVNEAIAELKRRREDKKLGERISEFLCGDVPAVVAGPTIKAVLFRQITTPNYESGVFPISLRGVRRFTNVLHSF
jgi:hypothetical protein